MIQNLSISHKNFHLDHVVLALILFAFLARFYHIGAPLLDHHSIRQIDTASIARNFYEGGFNLFRPQFDGGGTPGYVECEFQIYSYLVAILYKMFGVREYLGRLLSVICSLFTAACLYFLIKRIKDPSTALFSVFAFVASPLSIAVGRSFQPESMMLFFSTATLLSLLEWLETKNIKFYFLTILFLSLTLLIKIPNLFLGLPILFLILYMKGYTFLFRKKTVLLGFIPLLISFSWYFYAHLLFIKYGNTFIGGGNKFTNLALIMDYRWWIQIFVNRLGGIVLTPFGYLLAFGGLFFVSLRKKEAIFIYWLAAVLIYVFVVGQGNLYHDYYQYPLLPVMCFFCGTSLHHISRLQNADSRANKIFGKGYVIVVISLILALFFAMVVATNACELSIKNGKSIVEAFWNYRTVIWLAGLVVFLYFLASLNALKIFFTNDDTNFGKSICLIVMVGFFLSSIFFLHLNKVYEIDTSKLVLAKSLKSLTTSKDLIITTTDSSLGHLYYSHRKGWSYFRKGPKHLSEIEHLVRKGASFLLINKRYERDQYGDLKNFLKNCPNFELLFGYKLYKLRN